MKSIQHSISMCTHLARGIDDIIRRRTRSLASLLPTHARNAFVAAAVSGARIGITQRGYFTRGHGFSGNSQSGEKRVSRMKAYSPRRRVRAPKVASCRPRRSDSDLAKRLFRASAYFQPLNSAPVPLSSSSSP